MLCICRHMQRYILTTEFNFAQYWPKLLVAMFELTPGIQFVRPVHVLLSEASDDQGHTNKKNAGGKNNRIFILPFSNIIYCRSQLLLWVRLNRKWEIGIFPPQPPFSPGMIISEKIFEDCPLFSFTFAIYLGTSWTQPTAEEGLTIGSVSIQAGCRREVNKI